MSSNPQRLPVLDGLRAVSITLVVLCHFIWGLEPPMTIHRFASYMGVFGVHFFFVISGFLITHLLRQEREATGRIDLRAFYMRRALRILPPMYLYLGTIAVLVWAGMIDLDARHMAFAAGFLVDYLEAITYPLEGDWAIGHYWSLSVEEQFYLLWPFAIFAAGLRRAGWIAVAIVVASPALRFATYVAFPDLRSNMMFMFHCVADPLMVGCGAALLYRGARFKRAMARFASPVWPTAAAAFLATASPALYIAGRNFYWFPVGVGLNALLCAFLICWLLHHPASLAARVLEMRIPRYIGRRSYGIYLWQQLLLNPIVHGTWLAITPINFAAVLATAELSYQLVERPLLRLRSRLRPKPANPSPVSTA